MLLGTTNQLFIHSILRVLVGLTQDELEVFPLSTGTPEDINNVTVRLVNIPASLQYSVTRVANKLYNNIVQAKETPIDLGDAIFQLPEKYDYSNGI